MSRPKTEEFLRHEKTDDEVFVNFHDDDEDGFTDAPSPALVARGDSAIVQVPLKLPRGKGKRSLEDMMASQPNHLSQSLYALQRIAAAEDQIVKVLELCSPEARELVLKQRPSLRRYADDKEE